MMSGYAYYHTLRAHFLTQQALTSILLSQSSVTQLCQIYEDGLHGERCMAMLYRTQEWLPEINNLCKNVLGNIATLDMKAQLWVMFLYTIPLVQHVVYSECRGGWSLHLEITRKRLHLFHATGHIHDAKLVHLYHLKMCTLQDGHGQGWIPFLYRGRLLSYPVQRHVLGWCLVWHDQRTGIDTLKNGFWCTPPHPHPTPTPPPPKSAANAVKVMDSLGGGSLLTNVYQTNRNPLH